MDTLGTEVGHKMRAAIKAKLNELGCYVDDELPDYVMVMVANKRSRIQMEDDLQLFLGPKTEMFVYWLHQVLQKLQEVKIPPIVGSSKEADLKRQSSNESEITIKKEKREKRHKKSKKDEKHKKTDKRPSLALSLDSEDSNLKITDLLANQLLETVKKTNSIEEIVKSESNSEKINPKPVDLNLSQNTDEFDIPTISEIEKESSKLSEQLTDITEIDKRIENTRSELEGMKSDSDEDVININNDELSDIEETKEPKTTNIPVPTEKIVEPQSLTPPRKPMSERLGQKCVKTTTLHERVKDILTEKPRKPLNRNSDSKTSKNSIHSRLGSRPNVVSSKIIAVPQIVDDYEDVTKQVSVPSIIKVKPRPQIPANLRANSNLLLKAMAEAQKSVEQIIPRQQVVQRKPIELYTKKNRKQVNYSRNRKDMRITVKADEIETSFEENSNEYTPEPILNVSTESTSGFQEYIPSMISNNEILSIEKERDDKIELTPSPEPAPAVTPQFVVTLDGLDTSQFPSRKRKIEALKSPKKIITEQKQRSQSPPKKVERRKHTPIVFDEKPVGGEKMESKSESKIDSKLDSKMESKIESKMESKTESKMGSKIESKMDSENELPDNVKVIINETGDLKIGAAEKTVKLKETQSKYDHIPAVLSEVTKKERCKFYPQCRLGDSCEFLHVTPTVPCKAFPACKFGASCLYLHPKCKFGPDCIRKRDCPYNHSNINNGIGQITAPILTPALSSTVSVVPNTLAAVGFKSSGVNGTMCRFYPQCSNPQCMFYHPKMCRFGKYCHNKVECNFYHPEVPSKEKFVWKPAVASTAI